MMYPDPQQQQQHYHQQQQQQQQQQHQHQHHPQQQQGGEFHRGPPPPMMRQPSASSTNMTPDYHHPSAPGPPYDAHGDGFGAKRNRKQTQRRAVDYTSTVVRYTQTRMWQRDARDRTVLQPTPAAAIDMLPTVAYSDNPSMGFAAKFVHTSTNKVRNSINRVLLGYHTDVDWPLCHFLFKVDSFWKASYYRVSKWGIHSLEWPII